MKKVGVENPVFSDEIEVLEATDTNHANNFNVGTLTLFENTLANRKEIKEIEENAYALPAASASVRGGVKTGYTANGRNYPVQLDNEQMYVNVPWTDSNTTYNPATQSAAGLMSATDKAKLDGIASGANAYALPAASASVRGGVKTGYTANGRNYPVQLSNEQMYVNVPWTDNNTTYNPATQSANGLMSAVDKAKLDGIASGANAYTHPNSGVSAGTYRSVTVNAQGHVTGGSNPTLTVAQGGTGATTAAQALANIGAAAASHTHNYAGSASAGGTATRALGDSDGAQINATYRKKAEGSVVKIQASAPADTTALWAY